MRRRIKLFLWAVIGVAYDGRFDVLPRKGAEHGCDWILNRFAHAGSGKLGTDAVLQLAGETFMNLLDWIGLILTAVILIYLVIAMLFPEKFQ